MPKGTILGDTFEQLAELGASTAKKTVKSVAQTFNPFDQKSEGKTPEKAKTDKDHTPLDFNKLKNKYQDKDKLLAENLKNRFFQNVKREDEKTVERENFSEQQKKRSAENETYEKARRDQQKKQSQQQGGMPGGKAKRGTMTRKKSSEQQHVENKPASGKQ